MPGQNSVPVDTAFSNATPAGPASPGTTSIGAVRLVVVERLRAREAEIGDAIFVHCRDRVPDPVSPRDPEYLVGLREAVGAGVDYMLTGIELGRGPALARPPRAALEQARRAARAGVGIDIVLARYVAGHTILGEYVMREFAHPEVAARGIELSELLGASATLLGASGSLLRRLTSPVRDAYREEVMRVRTRRVPTSSPTGPSGSTAAANTVAGAAPGPAFEHTAQAGTPGGGPGATDESVRVDSSSNLNPDSRPHPQRPARSRRMTRTAPRQRARILQATVEVWAEQGSTQTTLSLIRQRAQVSHSTFYNHFPGGLEQAMIAALDVAFARTCEVVSHALEQEEQWLDAVRAAIGAQLAFFDSEPALARVCMVESLGAPPTVLAHRAKVIGQFRSLVLARVERDVPHIPPLAAESILASAMGVIHEHMTTKEHTPDSLIALLGTIMGRIVMQFIADEQAAVEWTRRGDELAHAIRAGEIEWAPSACQPDTRSQTEQKEREELIPALIANRRARARQCFEYIATHPEPSNRDVGEGVGIPHPPHISLLLSQLRAHDLIARHSHGAGKCNSWSLTPYGEQVMRALAEEDRERTTDHDETEPHGTSQAQAA